MYMNFILCLFLYRVYEYFVIVNKLYKFRILCINIVYIWYIIFVYMKIYNMYRIDLV